MERILAQPIAIDFNTYDAAKLGGPNHLPYTAACILCGISMRRIENYRKGDRAEKLGVFLLQSICAVAEVPRQEDFGLMDAVVTLLRRDGRFLFAEDSFLVQTKSRTEKKVEFLEKRFEGLLNQDMPLMIARIDLTSASLELHTLGVALAHANINSAKGVVAHLRPCKSTVTGMVDDVLHISLVKPIVRLTTGDTENVAFTNNAYHVLKSWLTLERWNRKHRRLGSFLQVAWETNEVPKANGNVHMWHPSRARESSEELVPLMPMLTNQAESCPELRAPVLAIISWLQGRGVDADLGAISTLMLHSSEATDRLKRALDDHPDVDFALTFCLVTVEPDFLNFWVFSRNKEGTGGGRRHEGSLQQIRELGFEASVAAAGGVTTVRLGISEKWLVKGNLSVATPSTMTHPSSLQGQTAKIFLLRKQTAKGQ